MNTTTKTLTPDALINLLAEDLQVAARLAVLVIDGLNKIAANATEIGAIANVSIGDFEPVDVTVKHVDTQSLRDAYRLLSDNRMAFRAIRSAGGVTAVIGKADGVDWIRWFHRDGTAHLVVEAGGVIFLRRP